MRPLLRRLLADERARFVVVGGLNTVLAYGLFVLFELTLGGRYLLSLGLSYLLATLVAFVLHRRFTFGVSGSAGIVTDFLRFESVYVVMLAANAVLLPLLVEGAGLSSLPAQAIIVMLTTVVSYLGHRFFSFRRPRRLSPKSERAGDTPAPVAGGGVSRWSSDSGPAAQPTSSGSTLRRPSLRGTPRLPPSP